MTLPRFLLLNVEHQPNGALWIAFNRPQKYNAINLDTFKELKMAIEYATGNAEVRAVVLTGTGKYFSSGNDLTATMEQFSQGGDFETISRNAMETFASFVVSLIQLDKLFVVGVNGPAVGIGVTILGLTDFAYASTSATFMTPFMKLAQCPEACSSVTLPAIMGMAKANDLLIRGKTFTAQEALHAGLVSEVYSQESFQQEFAARVAELVALAPGAVRDAKKLIRGHSRDALLAVNKRECDVLKGRYTSEECMDAILSFATRKPKSVSKL